MPGTPSKGERAHNAPSQYLTNAALITAQVIFGISAVVGTIGLPSFHPLTFALIRESSATILLLIAAHFYSLSAGREEGILSGHLEDWRKFAISGKFQSSKIKQVLTQYVVYEAGIH